MLPKGTGQVDIVAVENLNLNSSQINEDEIQHVLENMLLKCEGSAKSADSIRGSYVVLDNNKSLLIKGYLYDPEEPSTLQSEKIVYEISGDHNIPILSCLNHEDLVQRHLEKRHSSMLIMTQKPDIPTSKGFNLFVKKEPIKEALRIQRELQRCVSTVKGTFGIDVSANGMRTITAKQSSMEIISTYSISPGVRIIGSDVSTLTITSEKREESTTGSEEEEIIQICDNNSKIHTLQRLKLEYNLHMPLMEVVTYLTTVSFLRTENGFIKIYPNELSEDDYSILLTVDQFITQTKKCYFEIYLQVPCLPILEEVPKNQELIITIVNQEEETPIEVRSGQTEAGLIEISNCDSSISHESLIELREMVKRKKLNNMSPPHPVASESENSGHQVRETDKCYKIIDWDIKKPGWNLKLPDWNFKVPNWNFKEPDIKPKAHEDVQPVRVLGNLDEDEKHKLLLRKFAGEYAKKVSEKEENDLPIIKYYRIPASEPEKSVTGENSNRESEKIPVDVCLLPEANKIESSDEPERKQKVYTIVGYPVLYDETGTPLHASVVLEEYFHQNMHICETCAERAACERRASCLKQKNRFSLPKEDSHPTTENDTDRENAASDLGNHEITLPQSDLSQYSDEMLRPPEMLSPGPTIQTNMLTRGEMHATWHVVSEEDSEEGEERNFKIPSPRTCTTPAQELNLNLSKPIPLLRKMHVHRGLDKLLQLTNLRR